MSEKLERSAALLEHLNGQVARLEPEHALRLARTCVEAAQPDMDELVLALSRETSVDGEVIELDTGFLERMVAEAPALLGDEGYMAAVLAPLSKEQIGGLVAKAGKVLEAREAGAKRRAARADLPPPDSAERLAQRCAKKGSHLAEAAADGMRCRRCGAKL